MAVRLFFSPVLGQLLLNPYQELLRFLPSVKGEKYYCSFVLLFLSNYIHFIRYLLATQSVIHSVFYKVSPGKNNQGNTIFWNHLLLLRIMKRKQESFQQSNILILFLIGLFMITGCLST